MGIEVDERVCNRSSIYDDLLVCVGFLARERLGEAGAAAFLGEMTELGEGGVHDRAPEMAHPAEDALFNAYRDFVNVREPLPMPSDVLEAQDRMLQRRIARAGIVDAAGLPRVPLDNRISLWRGDITTLCADAIVNAANSQMLGCWVPGHYCIDNAIHTFAGVQLRAECARLMQEQGYPEPTGMAKSTPAYNLPSKWIIHTVGPIANGHPSDTDRRLLANSYDNCLDAAEQLGAKSIAFCCISTGVFGFPQEEAAHIAVRTVREWLDAHDSDMHVVFNVFGARDESIYRDLLD